MLKIPRRRRKINISYVFLKYLITSWHRIHCFYEDKKNEIINISYYLKMNNHKTPSVLLKNMKIALKALVLALLLKLI